MKRKEFYALGIMSGTSTDGLDFSLIKSDGKEKIKIIQNKYYKFNHKFKMKILSAINEFKQLKNSNKENEIFKNLNEDFSKYVLNKLSLFFYHQRLG
jgi:1,6-anhydro-N-acetylmuramate kinase